MINTKEFWNQVTKSALILGGISIAYMLIGLIDYKGDGVAIGTIIKVLTFIIWGFKIWFCIWLLKKFLLKYRDSNAELTARDVLKFGRMTALLSALVFAAFTMAYYLFINPDFMKDAMDTVISSGIYNKAQLESLENLTPKMPTYAFVGTLIYCYLFGAIATKIIVKKNYSNNPFNNAD